MENLHVLDEDADVPLDDCTEIGNAELTFLRPMPRASKIEVTFSLTLDGMLQVAASDLTTGKSVQAEFKSDALMSAEELEKARARNKALRVS